MLEVISSDTTNLTIESYIGYGLVGIGGLILVITLIILIRAIFSGGRFPKTPSKIIKKMYDPKVKLQKKQKHWTRHMQNLWSARRKVKQEDIAKVPEEFTVHFFTSLLMFIPPLTLLDDERGKDYQKLPPIISNIQVVMNLLREFREGGLVGYFKSPYFVEMYHAAKAFREIGASQSADIIEDSFESVMDRSQQERPETPNAAMPYQRHVEAQGRARRSLQELSEELKVRVDKVYKQLAVYMRNNSTFILQYIQSA